LSRGITAKDAPLTTSFPPISTHRSLTWSTRQGSHHICT